MTLLEMIRGTYATVGHEMTDLQLEMILSDLTDYPIADVAQALTRCRRELRRLTLADILDRIPGGRPGPEEAWATVSQCMTNEQISVVWTDEMREAYGVAAPLANDPIAARMAFREKYIALVTEARATRDPIRWSVSLGHDKYQRELAVQEAMRRNQISAAHAQALLPQDHAPVAPSVQRLLDGVHTMPEEAR